MAPHRRCELETPLGTLALISDGKALQRILLPGESGCCLLGEAGDDEVLKAARAQLGEYFAGCRRTFDLPLGAVGTPFQRRVWAELARIPFGQRISYAELARRVESPRGFRAVGAANGRNPLPIVVPCHRVVGSNGKLTGFAGGLPAKAWLLGHEAAVI